MDYFGFFIDKTSTDSFLLNIFPAEDLPRYLELQNNNDINIDNFYTPYLEVSSKDDAVKNLFIGNTLNFFTNNWVKLSINKNSNGFSTLYNDGTNPETTNVSVSFFSLLRKKNTLTSLLKNTFSLDNFGESSEEVIQGIFKSLHGDFLAIYNVGQGSCNAVCDVIGEPLFYFDIGCGSNGNSHTTPLDLEICSCSKPPVILSHWHMDHWAQIKKNVNLYHSKWVVPNQPLSADAFKTAIKLRSLGNLIIYPSSITSININGGTLLKCNGTTQNSSGIAFLCNLNKSLTLLPGDSKYTNIPFKNPIDHLIVTHHGGAHPTKVPDNISDNNCHIYSFGKDNTYEHPLPKTITLHNYKWNNRFDTVDGCIAITNRCLTYSKYAYPNVHTSFFCSSKHPRLTQFFHIH